MPKMKEQENDEMPTNLWNLSKFIKEIIEEQNKHHLEVINKIVKEEVKHLFEELSKGGITQHHLNILETELIRKIGSLKGDIKPIKRWMGVIATVVGIVFTALCVGYFTNLFK